MRTRLCFYRVPQSFMVRMHPTRCDVVSFLSFFFCFFVSCFGAAICANKDVNYDNLLVAWRIWRGRNYVEQTDNRPNPTQSDQLFHYSRTVEKGKGNPYSITERKVPEMIPVLGSQPAGDVSHKPGGRLPYFQTSLQLPSQPLRALRGLLLISLLGEQRHDGCEQFA